MKTHTYRIRVDGHKHIEMKKDDVTATSEWIESRLQGHAKSYMANANMLPMLLSTYCLNFVLTFQFKLGCYDLLSNLTWCVWEIAFNSGIFFIRILGIMP